MNFKAQNVTNSFDSMTCFKLNKKSCKTQCYIHLTHLIAVLYLQVLLTIYAFPLDRY